MELIRILTSPETLAYLAGATYVAGLAITNQIVLRLMILAGTAFYILYYATVDEFPLWEAIYVSILIGVATLFGLLTLLARRSRLAVPRAHADIYDHFPDLPPGDFRALMSLAKRYRLPAEKQATTEGLPGKTLYYVISGATSVRKGDHAFILPPKLFLGEIAFLIGIPSSATTVLESGSEVLEWSFEDLQRKCQNSPRFKLALEAAISIDLAGKVALSMGKDAVPADRMHEPALKTGSSVGID